MKRALAWTFFWIGLALLFNVGVWIFMGNTAALNFLSGYLIEKSLSLDNLFVFLMIFSAFKISTPLQHRALTYGIIGAIVFRAMMIFGGVALVQHFAWILYIFGVFLIFTGIKMLFHKESEQALPQSRLIRFIQHKFPRLPPLFLVIILIELADILFAVDSIPAIFAITQDPLIIFSSNIFAILGLRALYFILAEMHARFCYLTYGLSLILVLIGAKLLLHAFFPIPSALTLGCIVAILAITLIASWLKTRGARHA